MHFNFSLIDSLMKKKTPFKKIEKRFIWATKFWNWNCVPAISIITECPLISYGGPGLFNPLLNRCKSDTVSEVRTLFSCSLLHFLSPLKKKAVILDVLICPVLKWWDETFNVPLSGPKKSSVKPLQLKG